MAKKMSVCEEFLALVNEKSGAEAMTFCLELLGKKCAAVEAAIELDDLHGNIQYPFTWAEDSLASADRCFGRSNDCDQSTGDFGSLRKEVFELGSEPLKPLVFGLSH